LSYLQEKLFAHLGVLDNALHLIDGIPVPKCYLSLASLCRSFLDIADYVCAS